MAQWNVVGQGLGGVTWQVSGHRITHDCVEVDDASDLHIQEEHSVTADPHKMAELPFGKSVLCLPGRQFVKLWVVDILSINNSVGWVDPSLSGQHCVLFEGPLSGSPVVGICCARFLQSGSPKFVLCLRLILEKILKPRKWRVVSCYPIDKDV